MANILFSVTTADFDGIDKHILPPGARDADRRRVRQEEHRIGERAFSSMMRGAGGIGWPASWTQDRTQQIQSFHRWVYIAIDCIAARIAAMPPRMALVHPAQQSRPHGPVQKAILQARYRKSLHAVKPHEEIDEVGPDHPLARLLARPNAWTKSPGRLWYQAALFLLLTGNHYQWIVPDQAFGKPLEIWTIPAHWCFGPRIGPAGALYYQVMPFVGGVGGFTIPADEVVHFAFDNPLNPIDGWAPTQAGAEWIDSASALDQSRYFTWHNGVHGNGAIELGPKYDPDDIDIDAIGSKFLTRYQGVRNAGMPFIMPPDAKFVPLAVAPKEMAYIESFPQMRDAVAALFRVPHEIMGITDAGSKTAYYGPMKQFNENAIFPLCRLIADVFTSEVCRRWDDHLRLWWEDHSPDAPEEVNAMLNLDLQHGLRSINEARAERGLEPRPEALADELLVMPNVIPLSRLEKQLEQQNQQAAAQARQQQQAQSHPQLAGGSPAEVSRQLDALAAGQGNPPSESRGGQPGQTASRIDGQEEAEDAALDVNDHAWDDRDGAARKAHEYNRRFELTGSGWRLTPERGRWKAMPSRLPVATPAAKGHALHNGNGAVELAGRSLPVVSKAETTDVKDKLYQVGQELSRHAEPAPMPGHGQIFAVPSYSWILPCAACGPYHVRVVSGEELRNTSLDLEEFGLIAIHEDFPLAIPPGEIWMSDRLPVGEVHFVLAGTLARLRALTSGKSDNEAYEIGLRKDKQEREKAKGSRFDGGTGEGDDPRQGVLTTIEGDGSEPPITVYLVDGGMVRGTKKVDFLEGGNRGPYPWVPRDEIWIEAGLGPHESSVVALHEYVERQLMLHHGRDYGRAHEVASYVEFQHRSDFTVRDLARLTPAVLREIPGWRGSGQRVTLGHEPEVAKNAAPFDPSKHPRGGNHQNPGEFSHGAEGGQAGASDEFTRYPSLPGAPGAPAPTAAYPPPEPEQTRLMHGQVRPAPAGNRRASEGRAAPSSAAERSPLHKSLEASPLRRASQLRGGVGQISLLTLDDGTQAVFKPASSESGDPRAGRAGVPHGTQYRREIAASRLADVLGFGDLVPPTTLRNQGGEAGSAQLYVAEAEEPLVADEPFDGPVDAARAAVFDYLIGHLDRHKGNWLVKDGKLVLIDNGLAFPTAYHDNDFFNMQFWEHAQKQDFPMPSGMGSLADRWPDVERALRGAGLEKEAIALTRQRFEAVTSGRYRYVQELPGLLPRAEGDLGATLGDMAQYYNRAARRQRMEAERAAAQWGEKA